MSNYLVSGGAGFIGRHLVEHLRKKGHSVIALDNGSNVCDNAKFIYGDVRFYRDIAKYMPGCDACFHLAAEISVDKSIEDPQQVAETNVIGTINVLEACRLFKVKLLFASSSEVYGSAQTDKMSETHPLSPQSPYAASKAAADRLCHSYFKTYNMDIVIVRNFNVFGEHQNDKSYGGVIAKFTKAALANQPLTLFGTGEQERDYQYVADAVAMYELALKTPQLTGEAVNFGSGKSVKIKDLAQMIKDITGSKSEIVHLPPRWGEVERLCCDTSKANSFGLISQTDLERDLKKYVSWYKEQNAIL